MGIKGSLTDLAELKRLAEDATKGEWRYGPGDGEDENPVVFVDLPKASTVAISILFEGDWATDVDAKFVSKANPAAVLALIAENERLSRFEEAYSVWNEKTEWVQESAKTLELGQHRADVLRSRIDQLSAENETLRASAILSKLLPDLDDALEDLEIHGRHDDQGYRKLKDWYRKMALACTAVDAAMSKGEQS